MRLVKCRKCGTGVLMDSTLMENMFLEMQECYQKARKTEEPISNSYIEEAVQLGNMITSIQYIISERDERSTGIQCELEFLLSYIKKNKLIPEETLKELKKLADQQTKALILKLEQDIKLIYGSYVNRLSNDTKPNPTEREAINRIMKEDKFS